MLVSIIIVSYNVCGELDECINSIFQVLKNIEFEILVVDNNSPDRKVENLQQKYPNAKFYFLNENLGFSMANNYAVQKSKSKYILILNPDTKFTEDFITPIIQFIENHDNVGACSPMLLNQDLTYQNSAGNRMGFFYETEGGFYKPLLVNFDLLKMKEKTMVHEVGYFERFFYKNKYWEYMGRSRDSALMYVATELAYGHGAFIPTSTYNFVEQGEIEYNYVYPIQLRYADSPVSKILYNDNGTLVTVSDFIRKHPHTFDKFGNADFMSQVYVEYTNGLKIYVNRHTFKDWEIDFSGKYGFFGFHAQINGKDFLYTGISTGSEYVLPPGNGWVCYFSK